MFNPQDRGIGKGKPLYTVCSRRLNPFFIVTVYVKLVKISRTYSINQGIIIWLFEVNIHLIKINFLPVCDENVVIKCFEEITIVKRTCICKRDVKKTFKSIS